MKFTIDIECTPEEARTFLGLPDVTEMQKSMLNDYQQHFKESLASLDPETMFTAMSQGMTKGMPEGLSGISTGMESLQKNFWNQMMGMANASSTNKNDKESDT
jgi:hypothetical protein